MEYFTRSVYGRTLIYPANAHATDIHAITGHITFNQRQLDALRNLGVECTRINDPQLIA